MDTQVVEKEGQDTTSASAAIKRQVEAVLSASSEHIFQTGFAGLDGVQQSSVISEYKKAGKSLYVGIRRSALALGQILCRLHAVVPHGSWGDTLTEMDIPQRTADSYMADYKKAIGTFPVWFVTLAAQQKVNLGKLTFIEAALAITIPAQEPSANEALGLLSRLVQAAKKRPETSLEPEATPQTYDGLFREAEAFVRKQTGVKDPSVTLVCDIADLLILRLKAKQDSETGTVTFPEAN
jgi:hypothetical protein